MTGLFSLQFWRVMAQSQVAPLVWPLMTSPFMTSQHNCETDLNLMAFKRDTIVGQKAKETQCTGQSSNPLSREITRVL